jgi:hypothetical protein
VHIFDLWRFGILLHRAPALVIKALTYLQTHYNDFENMAPHNPDRQEARFLDMFQFMYRIPPTTVHENLAAMFKREEIYWEKLDEKVHVGIQMGYLDPTLKPQLQSILESRRLYRQNPQSLDVEKATQLAPILQRIIQMEIDNTGRLLERRYRLFPYGRARYAGGIFRR